jgi:glutamate-ammonia-ligase adenylyltransferase
MAAHKPARGPLDAKLLRGGLVDLEFLVHFLQLRERTALDPWLGGAVAGLVAAGLLPPALREAHHLLARLLIAGRLFAPDGQYPPPASWATVARAAGCETWEQLVAQFGEARRNVASAWREVFGEDVLGKGEETRR